MASTAIYRASVRGARRPGYALSRAGRVIQRELLTEMSFGVGRDALRIARAYAPHDSGRLERGLDVSVRSYAGRITATLRSSARSDAGYPYTDVTRFGHRKAFIYPHPPRRFLRWQNRSGGFTFARRVRGQRPAFDWVGRAAAAIDVELDRAEDRIGRQIASRIL